MNKKTIAMYWQHIKRHKRTFYVMLIAIPLGAVSIDSLLPYLLSQSIGILAEDGDGLAAVLWAAAAVGLLGAAFNYIGFQAMVRHEAKMLRDLREDTFEQLIRKDYTFFTNQKIGAMTSRYMDFVRSYVTVQDLLIIRTIGFILSVGVGVVILAQESLLVAGIILALIAILILEIRWSTKKRAPWRHERKELVGQIHGKVADALTNNLVVKSYAGETKEIADLHEDTERFGEVYRKDIGFIVGEGSVRVILMVVVQVLAIVISVSLIQSGQMSIAIAIFVLAYMQRIGSQLFVLSDIIVGFDQALLDAQPMTEMLLTNNAVEDTKGSVAVDAANQPLRFNSASFRYTESKEQALDGIDITIPAGQKVGLVGHSGAGKSTLVSLLLRFADVTEGSISIGEHDLRSITQESLRSNIAYVPQEPMLFHRSIRENITYGKPDATEKEVVRAAKQANAYEFIEKLPQGLDTLVGERGVKLSGGQKQRIAIARALLKDAPLLVLDEATSALDSESERLIQDSLKVLMEGRTSIVIAHRLSTIAALDRIIVMDNGRIIEDGSHKDLIAKKGTYAGLWAHQSGGFIEE